MSSIDRAFDIIEAILDHEEGLTLSDLAEMTGSNSSTVHRLCTNLIKRGYLYQKKKRENYLLGHKFLQFRSFNVYASIQEQGDPFLDKLCEETSETVMLAIFFGITAVGVNFVFPKHILQAIPDSRGKYPLHCTSPGKILLAHMSEERIKNTIRVLGLKAYTDNTITDEAQLITEIETVRRDGVAFDEEEYLSGVMSVAAPIKGENGELLASMALVCPTLRVNSLKLRQLAPIVKRYALEFSSLLGYK